MDTVRQYYTGSITAGAGGSVTAMLDSLNQPVGASLTKLPGGGRLIVTAAPDKGYRFDSWDTDDNYLYAKSDNVLTTNAIGGIVSIEAKFLATPMCAVTILDDAQFHNPAVYSLTDKTGSYEGKAGINTVEKNSVITVNFQAPAGMKAVLVSVDSFEVTAAALTFGSNGTKGVVLIPVSGDSHLIQIDYEPIETSVLLEIADSANIENGSSSVRASISARLLH